MMLAAALPRVLLWLLRPLVRRPDSRILHGAALLMLVGRAEAASIGGRELLDRPPPIIQEQSFDYLGPSGGRTLFFAQFDDLGGSRPLLDVVLELLDTSTWLFHVQADNNAAVNNTVTVGLTSTVQAAAPANLVTSMLLSDAQTAAIAPLQTYDFGELTDSASASANLVGAPDPNLTPFIGQGTIQIEVSNTAGLEVTCSVAECNSTVSVSHDQWRILATLRLTYVYVDSPTSTGPQDLAHSGFGLGTPRPNPARGVSISYFPVHVPWSEQVHIELFDVTGRRIARSASTTLPAGDHLVSWRPPPLASGIYTVRLQTAAGAAAARRWTILR
ncbi:MAG TPA: T9SS type A sorting domain-containing protein [Candidatus Krumholzibacteria bacterium]|nr:T9SS type A sorting domain-containing protein [Candidatus Krumholzibacteria bacterium]